MAKKIKVEKEVKVEKKTSYDVLGKDGKLVRTYSLEVQGENFAEYANTFAKKIGGKVV